MLKNKCRQNYINTFCPRPKQEMSKDFYGAKKIDIMTLHTPKNFVLERINYMYFQNLQKCVHFMENILSYQTALSHKRIRNNLQRSCRGRSLSINRDWTSWWMQLICKECTSDFPSVRKINQEKNNPVGFIQMSNDF